MNNKDNIDTVMAEIKNIQSRILQKLLEIEKKLDDCKAKEAHWEHTPKHEELI